jgi:hypothetical protein
MEKRDVLLDVRQALLPEARRDGVRAERALTDRQTRLFASLGVGRQAPFADAIQNLILRDDHEWPPGGQPEAELPVLSRRQRGIERPDAVDRAASNQHIRSARHEALAEEFRVDVAFAPRRLFREQELPAIVDERRPAVGRRRIRASLQTSDLALQLVRRPQVVSVDERDEFPARLLDAAIARRRQAFVGVAEHAHPRILKALDAFHGAVGRAVVDHDELELRERLSSNGLDRGRQRGLGVVDRHDH